MTFFFAFVYFSAKSPQTVLLLGVIYFRLFHMTRFIGPDFMTSPGYMTLVLRPSLYYSWPWLDTLLFDRDRQCRPFFPGLERRVLSYEKTTVSLLIRHFLKSPTDKYIIDITANNGKSMWTQTNEVFKVFLMVGYRRDNANVAEQPRKS